MDNLFREELKDTIEKYSRNSRSGVSAEVLTSFVVNAIDTFDQAVMQHNGLSDQQLQGQSTGQNRSENLNRRNQGTQRS